MALGLSDEELAERVGRIVGMHSDLEGPLLPILHAVEQEFGCVPEIAIREIADRLNLSRAEVHGVRTFYHDFRGEPAGRHTLKVCRAEACQSVGAADLADGIRAALGIDWHETTPDGKVTLEPVYCLGLCSCAPAVLLDDAPYGRLDLDAVRDLVAEAS
ncbi:formate dehydrogenase subunit gamma [Roseibium aggregatum]|uniref:Formate dehydrogenase subunit gamma n=1 Tax=Roseibium aggregatum TaxID=187304 RepID=A0A926S850_9HYPH|nr:formate dehydrogenase subunit gamma [Roseibium aggregatum]MBD1549441.1 formate dehydrogenase subunit gamma [Roseibium aggregatum]